LRGRNVVVSRPSPGLYASPDAVYSFEADFDEVLRKATSELSALGLVSDDYRGDPYDQVIFHRPYRGVASGAQVITPGPLIVLLGNAAYEKGAMTERRGWISVELHDVEDRSWFDNLRSWLGF
jgi:hypothetical protein